MKALTVQQPWAWAIIHGGKLVENRTTMWRHRGILAIHAGTRWSARGSRSPLVWEALHEMGWHAGPEAARRDERRGFDVIRPLGAVIGTVRLVDVHVAQPTAPHSAIAACCESPWAETSYDEYATRRVRRDVVHLVLEDPVQLADPIPYIGSLGMWDLPDDVLVA